MTINPARPNPAAMEFLATRRSRPAKTLTGPAPDRAALTSLLTSAVRAPDHGKLEPWRLIVLERAALDRLARLAADKGAALGIAPDKLPKGVAQFADSPLCVAVVYVPRSTEKVPEIEQILSAGSVCLGLVNAALAAGWGASWLTGWVAHERGFAQDAFGLGKGEWVAGLIHIGTEGSPPPERPRPDIDAITTWVSA
ncbi:nitroreductase [Albirhodobacter sp. R86504]|uniref:nitroreductase family protein n=1 Tax=Albirhodobacter sp. R86504 TaxID=3093848 RepID=UPI00366C89B8